MIELQLANLPKQFINTTLEKQFDDPSFIQACKTTSAKLSNTSLVMQYSTCTQEKNFSLFCKYLVAQNFISKNTKKIVHINVTDIVDPPQHLDILSHNIIFIKDFIDGYRDIKTFFEPSQGLRIRNTIQNIIYNDSSDQRLILGVKLAGEFQSYYTAIAKMYGRSFADLIKNQTNFIQMRG